MKKTLFTLFIVLVTNNISAQIIILDTDFDVFDSVYHDHVTFTNIQNVYISGYIESDSTITVKPHIDFSILIKDPNATNPRSLILGGSKGTILRSKPGVTGGGKTTQLISKSDIVINQLHNNLNIISTKDFIIGYTIYDIIGNIILSEKIPPTNNYNIDAFELNKAIYIIKVDLENQDYKTKKFIKN